MGMCRQRIQHRDPRAGDAQTRRTQQRAHIRMLVNLLHRP